MAAKNRDNEAVTLTSKALEDYDTEHDIEPLTPRMPFSGVRQKIADFFRSEDSSEYSKVASSRMRDKKQESVRSRIKRETDEVERQIQKELADARHAKLLAQSKAEQVERNLANQIPVWKQSVEDLIGGSEVVQLTYSQLVMACGDYKQRRNHDSRIRFHQTLTVMVGLVGIEHAEALAIESGVANDLPFSVFSDLMVGNWLT